MPLMLLSCYIPNFYHAKWHSKAFGGGKYRSEAIYISFCLLANFFMFSMWFKEIGHFTVVLFSPLVLLVATILSSKIKNSYISEIPFWVWKNLEELVDFDLNQLTFTVPWDRLIEFNVSKIATIYDGWGKWQLNNN